MNNAIRGLVAGFAGTVVLSAIMLVKAAMGLMPELDVVGMLGAMTDMGTVGGWVIHFLIGTVLWGMLFATLFARIPGGNATAKGLTFGVAAWLLMMVMVMPLAGAGFFGLTLGIMAPVMTLVLHLVYGGVMGGVYGALARSNGPA